MITKDMLRAGKRGKGRTVVRLRTPHPVWGHIVVVKDLMNRTGLDRPDRIGVGPPHRGIAFGVALSDVEAILEQGELPERVTIANEFVDRDGHMIPRSRRMKCARCEAWMTVDILERRQECPHCRGVVVFEAE
jgi:hypothetical protein